MTESTTDIVRSVIRLGWPLYTFNENDAKAVLRFIELKMSPSDFTN